MKPALKRAAAALRRRPPAAESPAEGAGKRIKERLRLGFGTLTARPLPEPVAESSSIPEGSLVDTIPATSVGHIDGLLAAYKRRTETPMKRFRSLPHLKLRTIRVNVAAGTQKRTEALSNTPPS
ncbi:hypothetical protein NMY22_g18613 [Coprinellus aureogranulatus]|nr:hypothetical protein NMY22_g18613 [Coprinellus aureogranulatus]